MDEKKLWIIAGSGWACSALLLRKLWKAYQAEVANRQLVELATQVVMDAKFIEIINQNDF